MENPVEHDVDVADHMARDLDGADVCGVPFRADVVVLHD